MEKTTEVEVKTTRRRKVADVDETVETTVKEAEEVVEEETTEEEAEAPKPKRRTASKKKEVAAEEVEETPEEPETEEENEDEDIEENSPAKEINTTEVDVLSEKEVQSNEKIEKMMYEKQTDEEATEEMEDDAVAREKESIQNRMSRVPKKTSHDELTIDDKDLKQASKRVRKKMYSDNDIIPLNGELQFETEGEMQKRDYLELVNSKKSMTILTDRIIGTKTVANMICAVVHHGFFKILIPAKFFIADADARRVEEESNPEEKEKLTRRLVNQRIGSEIDYIIENLDEQECCGFGNRLKAMEIKKRAALMEKDYRGNYVIHEGAKFEARVVSSLRNTITIEFAGKEYTLGEKYISYVRIPDVSKEYPVGTTVPFMFTKVERPVRNGNGLEIITEVSIKSAMSDPRERYFRQYSEKEIVIAVVTGIEDTGIFARLEGIQGKHDIMLAFPTKAPSINKAPELPQIGDNVLVRISRKEEFDPDTKQPVYRIYGNIIRNLTRQ